MMIVNGWIFFSLKVPFIWSFFIATSAITFCTHILANCHDFLFWSLCRCFSLKHNVVNVLDDDDDQEEKLDMTDFFQQKKTFFSAKNIQILCVSV